MSTQTPPVSAPPVSAQQEIVIVSHSNLFYWWPVWTLGFLFFLLTLWDGDLLAFVPKKTVAASKVQLTLPSGAHATRDALIVDEGRSLPTAKEVLMQPKVHIARTKNYGVIFAVVLFLVIVVTNVPLRGMWSLMVIVVLIFLTILFAALDWWTPILEALELLQIYINAGGYLAIAVGLLAIWVVTLVFFDRQVYMVFTPGQVKVCQEIGGGESMFPTFGVNFQKQRSDLFRHWILGLGSGDLVVKTSGANPQHFEMRNVLFISSKVQQIEAMLRDQPVVKD
jgi:hypothetical protein